MIKIINRLIRLGVNNGFSPVLTIEPTRFKISFTKDNFIYVHEDSVVSYVIGDEKYVTELEFFFALKKVEFYV